VLIRGLRHNKVLHERVVILTVVTERVPSVAEADRIKTEEVGRGHLANDRALRFCRAAGLIALGARHLHRADELALSTAETLRRSVPGLIRTVAAGDPPPRRRARFEPGCGRGSRTARRPT
jgi:hypothetical protein